jgi:nucleoside-diphosphate-sugar epimerase
MPSPLPTVIRSNEELTELLTRPSPALVDFIGGLEGPLMVLGASGKMGPTLCLLAKRAAEEAGTQLDITAASRFSDATTRQWLEDQGIRTLSLDLLDAQALQALPDAPNVIHLTGLKFGTSTNPSLTWATNTLAPSWAAGRYATSRIVALSTGNVYPLLPVRDGGAKETDALTPIGEYANAAVARERVLEHWSRRNGTRMALIRLFYAVEMRYGVLVDIARRVWEGRPVDVTNGWFNGIWQGDANELILRALSLTTSPASAWNLSSRKPLSVRMVAERCGELLGKPPQLTGQEAPDALLCDPAALCDRLDDPATPLDRVIEWTADWVRNGGTNLNKATSFEVRDGRY